MKKIVSLSLSLILSIFLLTSCDSDETTTAGQNETRINNAVMGAAMEALSSSMGNVEKGTISGTVSWHNSLNTVSVTGTFCYDNSTGVYNYTLSVVFTNYSDGAGMLINGATSCDVLMNIAGDRIVYSYDGNFVVVYGGSSYTLAWDYDISYDGTNYTCDGTYTLNGTEYPVSFSGQ